MSRRTAPGPHAAEVADRNPPDLHRTSCLPDRGRRRPGASRLAGWRRTGQVTAADALGRQPPCRRAENSAPRPVLPYSQGDAQRSSQRALARGLCVSLPGGCLPADRISRAIGLPPPVGSSAPPPMKERIVARVWEQDIGVLPVDFLRQVTCRRDGRAGRPPWAFRALPAGESTQRTRRSERTRPLASDTGNNPPSPHADMDEPLQRGDARRVGAAGGKAA